MNRSIDESRKYAAVFIEERVLPILATKAGEAKRIIELKVGPAILSFAENEAACTIIFETIYQILPAPIRFLLKREAFVTYCLKNKTKILSLIEPTPSEEPVRSIAINPQQ